MEKSQDMSSTAAGAEPTRRALLQAAGAGLVAAGLTAGLARGIAAQDATPMPGGATSYMVEQVSLAQALVLIQAAVAESEKRGLKMITAVVDTGANLVALGRMDGAWLASLDIAIKKARTSAMLLAETGIFGPLVQPGQPLYGAENSNGGLITFPGGIPIMGANGAVIGAIGVSGSTVEDDQAVAEAALAALAG